ncbi:unnamed protein product [Allacma fusca]|uniref:Uncharacterized protein n=1 Tax=Allacma fusca TaxID=39272 RepID=A0A8J2LYY6_9HEXA|nr:unnamed protein product [Allacma fusca]
MRPDLFKCVTRHIVDRSLFNARTFTGKVKEQPALDEVENYSAIIRGNLVDDPEKSSFEERRLFPQKVLHASHPRGPGKSTFSPILFTHHSQ